MIDLSALAGLLEHHHRLDAYCPHRDQWAEIDLAAMAAVGLGDCRLRLRVTCRDCGAFNSVELRWR
jgi:hypothetical protein